MTKRKTALIMAIVLMLSAVLPAYPVLAADSAEFSESTLSGYKMMAKTQNAQYYFVGDDEAVNTVLFDYAEAMISVAKKEYGLMETSPRIFFTDDDEQVSVGSSMAIINPDSPYMLGHIFSYMSGGKLPAWLCVGLDLFWAEKNGVALPLEDLLIDANVEVAPWVDVVIEKGLPGFGDEWFTPGLFEDNLAQYAPSIAYAFVKYLDKADLLTELVKTYAYLVSDKRLEAEKTKAEAWLEFSGREAGREDGFLFWYPYNRHDDGMYTLYGAQGTYYIQEKDKYWSYETILLRSTTNEEAIQFVKDWFGFVYETPFKIWMTVKPLLGSEGVSGHADGLNIRLFECHVNPLHLVARGVAHTILYLKGLEPDIIPPIQGVSVSKAGVSNAVALEFAAGDQNRAQTHALYLLLFAEPLEHFPYVSEEQAEGSKRSLEILMTEYTRLTDKEYTDEPFDLYKSADAEAVMSIKNLIASPELVDIFISYGYAYPYMIGYETAASFTLYLLHNKGTKEDFERILVNDGTLEEVYGKDLDGLIAEWMEYIGVVWPF